MYGPTLIIEKPLIMINFLLLIDKSLDAHAQQQNVVAFDDSFDDNRRMHSVRRKNSQIIKGQLQSDDIAAS
jgi:hypothetical protein